MKKILAVALVLSLTVMVIQPMVAEAGGGGRHGGGSHSGHGYRGAGPWLFGIAALGVTSAILAPRAYAYPAYPPVVYYTPAPVVVAPYPSVVVVPQARVSIQRTTCYPDGCFYLQGNGVQVPYQWVWMPR